MTGTPSTSDPDLAAYLATIDAARADRNAGLREPLSWLSVVGLHWLHAGSQSFGADPGNEIVLRPVEGVMRPVAGTLQVADGRVRLHPAGNGSLTVDGEAVREPVDLVDDADGEPTTIAVASLRFHLIRRGAGRLGLRVRDTAAPPLRAFDGVRCFDVDPAWRLVGRVLPAPAGTTIRVSDVVGDVTDDPTPGDVELVIDGTVHRLHALEAGADRLWLVFSDATNGAQTYGGGRFLVTGEVQADGTVEVDFNLAYNPPCVFSPYATCPLPPDGNRLPVRIVAGERASPGATGGGRASRSGSR